MMKRMRGRNLAHPGCLIGVTSGLIIGIVLAGVLAVANVPLNIDLLVWLGLTLVLAAIGWVMGSALSSRFPALEEDTSVAYGQEAPLGEVPPAIDGEEPRSENGPENSTL